MEELTKVKTKKEALTLGEKLPGWGMDANPANNPTYPIKKYTGDDHKRSNYEKVVPQQTNIEKLKSIERPELSRVFGTSVPPSGLSGMIRRYAFRYSEGKGQHWMLLILADRINMIEGIISDIRRGKFPNFFVERGGKALWKYDRKRMVKRMMIRALIAAAVITVIAKRRKLA
jgi:hypothetical protein